MNTQKIYFLNPSYTNFSIEEELLSNTGFELVPVRFNDRSIDEIADAVALTPAYLESNFTEFENVLAQHLGLEKGQRRLLAIMRKECDPELRMRAHLWLDMTDDDEFEMNVQRLVYELGQPPTK